MCHRIGGTVVTSTDNIILSKFAGLGIVGIYSNYSLLTASVLSFVNKVLNSFVASVGNYAVEKNAKEKKQLYKRLLFLNLWISSFCTICLYTLLNPFIFLWQGERFLLEKSTVLIICIQFFIQSSIVISGVFVNACGLFMKDKAQTVD